MRKKEHFLVSPTIDVLDPKPTQVDTLGRYLLALMILLTIGLVTGHLLGYFSVYGGLL
ncbi:MAG: hypothetical protein RSD57_14610 [Comamonas sp.]